MHQLSCNDCQKLRQEFADFREFVGNSFRVLMKRLDAQDDTLDWLKVSLKALALSYGGAASGTNGSASAIFEQSAGNIPHSLNARPFQQQQQQQNAVSPVGNLIVNGFGKHTIDSDAETNSSSNGKQPGNWSGSRPRKRRNPQKRGQPLLESILGRGNPHLGALSAVSVSTDSLPVITSCASGISMIRSPEVAAIGATGGITALPCMKQEAPDFAAFGEEQESIVADESYSNNGFDDEESQMDSTAHELLLNSLAATESYEDAPSPNSPTAGNSAPRPVISRSGRTTIGEEIRQFVMRLGDGRYACKLCDQSFKQGNNLYRHIRSLHLLKKHHCPECGKEFPRKDSLKDHLKTTHGLSMAAYYANSQGQEGEAAQLADEAICSSTTPSSLLGCGEYDSNMASLDSSDMLQY